MKYNILYFTIPLTLSMAILFSTLTHPLSMGLTLLTQTILICVLSGLSMPSFWFSYILFLIFLGGMLILFIYVSSLASNEAFKIHLKSSLLVIFSIPFSSILIFSDPLYLTSKFFSSPLFLALESKTNLTSLSTSPIYSLPSFPLTTLVILYLLLTLIVIVNIINIASSPLRPSKL
uniref:NADH-ubiquinone oxidoreductase chain 6 n=1 Tax=Cherax bicarinatus TaxID=1552317 RepID=A0A0B4ZYL8_9EUCA|nr:NADH dehydrogenase subunit 6 [Cherax bicarinatus]AJD80507.1 NADH dehydrogenase subunit 6 [Cherax bicarinatus]